MAVPRSTTAAGRCPSVVRRSAGAETRPSAAEGGRGAGTGGGGAAPRSVQLLEIAVDLQPDVLMSGSTIILPSGRQFQVSHHATVVALVIAIGLLSAFPVWWLESAVIS